MTNKQKTQLMIAVIIVGGGAIAVILSTFTGDQSSSPSNTLQQPTQNQPFQTQAITPQPPGDAPLGKVWSPEHGHWHDAAIPAGNSATIPAGNSATIPVQNIAQPAGDAPPGKVWSPEHGHWHNASTTPNITVQNTNQATPPDSQ